MHGSVNWAREVETAIDDLNTLNTWETMYRLIDIAPELQVSRRYRVALEMPIGKAQNVALVPAVAIPLERKREFECPEEHLEALRACVPEVTNLLVIGWRGMDQHLVELLAGGLRHRPKVMVVAGGESSGREVVDRLQRAGINGDFSTTNGGFTQFVLRRELEDFSKD